MSILTLLRIIIEDDQKDSKERPKESGEERHEEDFQAGVQQAY